MTKFWIGVASKDHVAIGVKLGICQFCHGKFAPCSKLSKGDFVVYYSSKISIYKPDLYQKFTAIGKIIDNEPYQVFVKENLAQYRRNIEYFQSKHIEIKPLIHKLRFIKNKTHWGCHFRYGFFEIDELSFDVIKTQMINTDC